MNWILGYLLVGLLGSWAGALMMLHRHHPNVKWQREVVGILIWPAVLLAAFIVPTRKDDGEAP